jgi:hypothetical protein
MTTHEAAAYLQERHDLKRDPRHLSRLCAAGAIKAQKAGRDWAIRPAALDQWARTARHTPGPAPRLTTHPTPTPRPPPPRREERRHADEH